MIISCGTRVFDSTPREAIFFLFGESDLLQANGQGKWRKIDPPGRERKGGGGKNVRMCTAKVPLLI
jgi:hypothetical protein